MKRLRYKIYPDGTVRCIYKDFLAPLIQQAESHTSQRVSYVDQSPGGQWNADMSPVFGNLSPDFETRAEALAWEEAYVNEHVL